MAADHESTLGERMQGTPYEVWANIAQGVLAGRHTLTEEMEYYSKNKIDWEFVRRYIAKHKHEYPDHKE